MQHDSRRQFLGTVATGLATSLSPQRVLGANERIRLGIIGPGARGVEIAREALQCPNTEFVAVADIYTRRLEESKQWAPNAKTYLNYRDLLDNKDVDAVLIATPQHLHCEHFTAALEAGKHVYQEKTMAFTVDHAKRMRTAFQKAPKQVVQIGHQSCSFGMVKDAEAFTQSGKLGKVTAIHAHMYRNTPHGKAQWSRPTYPDMTPENVLWNSFLGDAPKVPFDANRYINWRFFWDYSGGNVYENMCHQAAFWYRVMNLSIPKAVTMVGGVYLWKDGREVPDTMNVSMELPEEILFTWDSGFGNNHFGSDEAILGTDGTVLKGQRVEFVPQKVNAPDAKPAQGATPNVPRAHMQNFLDSVRGEAKPNCPFEIGFRVSILCRMAVESYRQGRTMRWDPVKEEIL